MTDDRPERVLTGIAASPGVALGPLVRVADTMGTRVAGRPDEEAAALRAATTQAGSELAELMAAQDALGAEILEFQALLLEDEDLTGPIFRRIAGGEPADLAWRTVMDAEVADYAAGEDAYLAARASDMADLRDRVLRALVGAKGEAALPPDAILLADDLTPSRFLELDLEHLGGVALAGASPTSHVAILARARGVPMVVALGACPGDADGWAALDADAATLTLNAGAEATAAVRARLTEASAQRDRDAEAALHPAATASGEPVSVMINVDHPDMLQGLSPQACDGIGLVRTEFLFTDSSGPSEAAQADLYAGLLHWAEGRPVTIRTLDAGGDKPIPGPTPAGETNPFLGVRGLRLSLRHPDTFRRQLRAMCRAAMAGSLKIMVPMVTAPWELEEARAHLDAAVAELTAAGVPHARPPLGIMVETPAAALTAADWPADFYSIGSNDLIQYVTASARDNPEVAGLADARNPAVLELIERTVAAGRARGVEVSLCGDMASDPALVTLLIARGLRVVSVAPAQVGRVKRAIAACA